MNRPMNPDETTRQALIALIPRLRRFARVLTAGSIADADDVVQASLEKAMVNLDQWQPGTRLDAWVFRIARNHWVDDRRRAHNAKAHDDIGEMLDLAGLPRSGQITLHDGRTIGYDDLVIDTDVAKVSVVGIGMRSHTGVAAMMFKALSAENVNIKVIATSEIKISVLIDRKYMELAVQALHDAFELEKAGRA